MQYFPLKILLTQHKIIICYSSPSDLDEANQFFQHEEQKYIAQMQDLKAEKRTLEAERLAFERVSRSHTIGSV